jgi:hypothetical protein
MELKDIKTLDELKELGTIEEIKTKVEDTISPIKISANSFEELLEVIFVLKEKWIGLVEGPFVSKEAEYIYYLTELDGKNRTKKLGITDKHYVDKDTAKKWYREIAKLVHPDKNNSNDNKAFEVLTELYKVMTDESEDEADE